jgi:caa(3)-type oxidase subunit IV
MAVEYKNEEKPVKKHANYLLVFFALAALTVAELIITQIPTIPHAPILIPLSFIKAALVALFYMHLRSDRRIFSFSFGLGIILGIAMVISFVLLVNTGFGHNH